jgi:hypothetical protein
MLGDLVVLAAFLLTAGFGAAAWYGQDELAAWLAGGLAIASVLRLVTLIADAYWPDE